MKRQVYLSLKPLEEAKHIFFSRFHSGMRTGAETIKAADAQGRVTAEAVFAKRSSPSYHSSAMDGVVVRAEQTYGTTERNPKVLQLGEDALWVNTGQPIPESFDAVIMVEKLHQIDDSHVEIRSPAYPWQHVRKVGEDIVATELLFPVNHRVRPYDIGALISGGVSSLQVWKRPKVAVIPTGSELINHRDAEKIDDMMPGQIIEFNSLVIGALVRECGGSPIIFDIVPDQQESILKALHEAFDFGADVIIINAGSSAGSKDYTVHVVSEMGEVLVHGVAMMPGKPTLLGVAGDRPIIGNPGYAVSSTISFDQFVRPLLCTLQGLPSPPPKTIAVQPTRDIPSKVGTEEFLRVNIGKVGPRYVATPLSRAAGSVTTLTKAEGILRIPAMSEGLIQGKTVTAELLVEEQELLNTVVVIGSHDITIDILGDEIRTSGRNIRISSGNVGSLGGLLALRKGSCHMSGSHLLDAQTGEYNIPFIRKYVKGLDVSVFHLVLREQGLIVPKGNPKGIRGIEDLSRKDVAFVNRQAGSGTRVLLDYKLGQLDMSPQLIRGFAHEEYTHMNVAVAVLSGAADCGMGIFAAARALDLDFVPIVQEQYDLIVPTLMLDAPHIKGVLETIRSKHFRERVRSLGGYDPSLSGELFAEMKGG